MDEQGRKHIDSGFMFRPDRQTRRYLLSLITVLLVAGCVPRGGTGDPQSSNGNPYYHFLLGENFKHQAESLAASDEEGSSEKWQQALKAAVDEFRAVLLLDPDACDASEELVDCLIRLGREKDAAHEIEDAVGRGCSSVELFERQGLLALDRGDIDAARTAFAAALDIDPGRIRSGIKLAELKEKNGDIEGALEVLGNLYPAVSKLHGWIARWRARLLSQELRWEEAYDVIEGVLAETGGDAGLFEFRAGLLERMGDFSGARDSYFEILARSPFDRQAAVEAARLCSYMEDILCINFLVDHFENTDGSGHPWQLYLRVAGLLALSSPESAAELLRENGTGLEKDAEFIYWSGRAAEALGLAVDAERAYREAARTEPGHDQAVSSLVLLLVKQDRLVETIDPLLAGIASEPADPYQHFMLGLLYFELEDFEGARDSFLDARKLGMIRHEFLDLNLGSVLERLGDYPGAEEHFRRSLELNPLNYDAMNYIAYMHAELGEGLEEGLELATRADSLNPDNPYILDTIAWLHYKKGNPKAALGFIEKALDIHEDPEILLHAGDILQALGRPGDAEEHWDKALEFSRNPDEDIPGGRDDPEPAE